MEKKYLLNKFGVIIALLSVILNLLPIQAIAETIHSSDTVDIVVSAVTFTSEENHEITEENRIEHGSKIKTKLHWRISEASPIEEGTTLIYKLPENLMFQNTQGELANEYGTYHVNDNLLYLTLKQNYQFLEDGVTPDSESLEFYESDLELEAMTAANDAAEEIVDFGNNVLPMLYYEASAEQEEAIAEEEYQDDYPLEELTEESNDIQAARLTRAGMDISSLLDVTAVKLEKNTSAGWVEIMDGDSAQVGDIIRLTINWEMLNSLAVVAGDYIEIDLPSIFKFAPTAPVALNVTVDGVSYNVGQYRLNVSGDHSKLRIEFNDVLNTNNITSITNGYLVFQGSLNETKEAGELVEIGTIPLPNFEIGETPLYEVGPNTYKKLSKEGSQRANENSISWRIVTNYDDLMRAYKGEALVNKFENTILVDALEEGLEVTSISLQIPVLMVDAADSTKLYAKQVHAFELGLTQVSPSATYEQSYDAVKASTPGTYTIFIDSSGKQTVIMNLGNFPVTNAADTANSLSFGPSKAAALQRVSDVYDSNVTLPTANKANTLAAFERLFDASQDTGIVGFLVNIVTKVDDDHLDQESFDNDAALYFENGNAESGVKDVQFEKIDGGGDGTIPKGTVEIVKKDQDSLANLPNVVFSVVKYDGDVEGAEVEQKTTDSNGKVTFENLAIGKYKLKEVSGLDQYNPRMIIENQAGLSSEGVFEIKVTDTKGFQFTIYNKKKATSISLEATKSLIDKTLAADQFEFELVDDQGTVLQTKTNDANGNIYFDAIAYTAEGVHEYTIREKVGTDNTITYDPTIYQATVTVEDKNDQLEATVVYSDIVQFENEYTPKAGSAVLEGTKVLTGKTLVAGEFEFELVDDQGVVLQTKTNDANGNIYFDVIAYTAEGVHEYTIREKVGTDNTITYDPATYQATVTVEDKGGQLEATIVYSDVVQFENQYEPKAGSAVLEGTKVLTGKTLVAGEFEFELVDDQGAVLQTKTNDANGNIYFDAIAYTAEGVHEYTIREKAGNVDTITYDPTTYQATVTVEDKSGQLEATVVYSDIVQFENQYTPKAGSAVLEGTKVLTGKTLVADQFEFELVDDQGVVLQTKTNDANGNIHFDAIAYTAEGVHEYTIREKVGTDNTITYDPTTYQATVTVEDKGGQFEATIVYSDVVQFENQYEPKAGSAVLEGTKVLTGKALTAGEFEFELVDDQGVVLQTKSNDANGNIYFDAIAYTAEGVHEYTIREKAGNVDTITYDPATYQATVTVEDKGGQLEATVVYSDIVQFENEYTPKAGSTVLEGTKVLTGKALTAGEFEFELVDDQGAVLQTKTNDANGDIYFDAIAYTAEGVHKYTIREKAGNVDTITCDPTTYQATVTVEDKSGQLEATVVYSDIVQFENQYTPLSSGKIHLKKIDDKTGATLAGAEFELQYPNGDVVEGYETITTDANGEATIENLEAGSYQVVETKAPTGYVIDTTPITFEVTEESTDGQTLTKKNKLEEKGVVLKKVDSATQKVLKGAEFELRDEKSNVIKEKLITDENGLIYLGDLEPGNYQFVETKAPQGYQIDTTPVTFSIVADSHSIVAVVKENKAIKTLPSTGNSSGSTAKNSGLPKTGSEYRKQLEYLGILCLFLMLLLTVNNYRKRKA
ncbi:Spy0128 family protein [Enterococcus larvae]|uniref:Spy0128 family protein n=1 Tax=Enterococcus larvae TaxID=2794352 RepID=UPI003F3DCB2C